MNTLNVDLSTGEALNLPIGKQGENNVTQVIFDFSSLVTEFGSGTLSLSVQRPKEYVPYAQTLTVSGTNATWLVNETDTGNFGCGEIQLTYTVGGKVAKTVIYKYTVLRSIGADGEYPIPGQTWQEEMEDEIDEIKQDLAELGGGLSDELKSALDQLAQKVAYIDEDGQDYYEALHNALYPPAELSSISAVYTQSGTVYDTDSLDSLKTDLVVTAHYTDSTSEAVTNYTLSGTLAVGTSTVSVSYGGKTTTFNVIVTHATTQYSITNALIHVTNSNSATVINEYSSYSAVLSAESGYAISTVSITMGDADITETAYNDGAISIASVTGDIYITATAIVYVPTKTVIGVTPLITIGDITLTGGMIDDNGSLTPRSGSYVYDEYLNGSCFAVLTSANDLKTSNITNYRTAGYDSSYTFIGRNYLQATKGYAGYYTNAEHIKAGWDGTTENTDKLITAPYSLLPICDVENIRILNDGTESQNSNFMSSDFIPINTQGVGAVGVLGGTSMVVGVAFYNNNKEFVSYFEAVTSSPSKYICPFEITSSMKYCRFTVKNNATAKTSLIIQEV